MTGIDQPAFLNFIRSGISKILICLYIFSEL